MLLRRRLYSLFRLLRFWWRLVALLLHHHGNEGNLLLVEGGRLIFVVVVVVVVYLHLRKIITIVVSSLSRRRNPHIFSASRRRWLLHRVLGHRRCLVAKKLEESTSDVITFLSRLRVNHVCVLHLVVVVADLLRGYDVAVVFLFLVVLI